MHTEVRMKPGSPYRPEDAPVIEAEIVRLIGEGDGVTREEVLAAATDPASPLHRFMTWDPDEAAHKCRLDEASKMLRSIEIRVVRLDAPKEEDWRRRLIVVKDAGESRYVPVETVARTESYLAQHVERARREWDAFRLRHKQNMHLPEFADLLDRIRRDIDDDTLDRAAD